ncbi:MAG: PilZ domain-containing protein [Planctomycetota bacterium]
MNTTITHDERREFFRLPADEDYSGAGVVVGKSVVPAQLLDYSVNGCLVLLNQQAKLELGDHVQVATFQGRFLAEVRHLKNEPSQIGPMLGLEFLTPIESAEVVNRTSTHLFSSSGKQTVSGNFGTVFIAILVGWCAVAYLIYAFFIADS